MRGRAGDKEMESQRGPRGASRRSPGALQGTARTAGVSPHSPGGSSSGISSILPGSSFPPCPCDFSAPESRLLHQVPPAASSPRGTPGATPLLDSHWLFFTPVTLLLAEGSPTMQIRWARRRADWLALLERRP